MNLEKFNFELSKLVIAPNPFSNSAVIMNNNPRGTHLNHQLISLSGQLVGSIITTIARNLEMDLGTCYRDFMLMTLSKQLGESDSKNLNTQ